MTESVRMCVNQHPQTPENVWISPDRKKRRCRLCINANKKRSRSGRSYAQHGGTLRRVDEVFCADCLTGRCKHQEIGCLKLVAPEPRDFPCKCGTRRPLWWFGSAGESDA